MRHFGSSRRGQLTVVAALLVAVVLISAVITTYSAIRYGMIEDQPRLLSAVDEINLALKELLGFTVGYYGSVLQVTGNTSYARMSASDYFESGLVNIADIRPEWGASFNISALELRVYWYSLTSYSSGHMLMTYDLAGIGVYGMTYNASCRLDVQVLENAANQSRLSIIEDGSEPLVALARRNLKFYKYEFIDSTWSLVSPSSQPLVYENGTYVTDFPVGVDPEAYLVKVEDSRGIAVVASSFGGYTSTLLLNSTYSNPDYVDSSSSDVDSSPDKGTQSNFTAQQYGPDGVFDTLMEANTGGSLLNVTLVDDESFEGNWLPTGWSETPSDSRWNKESDRRRSGSYSADFDGSGSGSLDTPSLDCSGVTAIYVDFWYYDEGCDNNEFRLYYYDGSNWDFIIQLGTGPENQWIRYQQKIVDTQYFKSNFKIRFRADPNSASEHAYIDDVTVKKEVTTTNYQLDLEEQWTNVNYTNPQQELCIKAGALGSETLAVDAWTGSSWTNIATLENLVAGWKNVSISSFLTSSTFTIRFRGNNEVSDVTQDSWAIDAVLIAPQPDTSFFSLQESTMVLEWLQNGTMRWLGQDLVLITGAKPIPPIPVRSFHLNQTINGVNREVPFQIEDWASEYQIPLGLTGNSTLFSNRQMIVSLIDRSVSEFTIWWNGSDGATQTPLAYTNDYFTDNPSVATLDNGKISLLFGDDPFTVTATVAGTGTSSTSRFMRINGEESVYGSDLAFVIYNGVVRDVIQQEAEWSTGAVDCPNLYANIVVTLPANTSYYTYDLRLMFQNSTQPRTITNLCPIRLTTSLSSLQAQTENGTASGLPIVENGAGTFSNYTVGGWTPHHWSQLNNSARGAGIMFTDTSNQELYIFDQTIPGTPTGALRTDPGNNLIELLPVTLRQAQFTYPLEVSWRGAIVTFDNTLPIYTVSGGTPTGLWILAKYPPEFIISAYR